MIIKQSTINIIAAIAFFTVSLLLGGSVYFLNSDIHEEQSAVARQAKFKQLGINFASFCKNFSLQRLLITTT
jgi:hypothetical protein